MNQRKGCILKVLLVIAVDYTAVVIQENQIELIEVAKETNTHSFGRSTITMKIRSSGTSVKSKIRVAQKRPLMEQQVLPYLNLKKSKLLPIPGSESEGATD